MSESGDKVEFVREAILSTFPHAAALDEQTLDDLIHERAVATSADEGDDSALHMDVWTVIDQVKEWVPVAAGIFTIVQSHYEIAKLRKDAIAGEKALSATQVTMEVAQKRLRTGSASDASIVKKIAQDAIDFFRAG